MPPRRANPNPKNNNNNITPEMQQMMNAQTQLMRMMTTFIQNQNNNNNNPNNNNNNNNAPGFDMLTRFLRLRTSKFSGTTDPMVANDWLRSVNKDLVTVGCTDAEKVRFAAHLLEGPAATWWDNFQITTPIDEVTWAIFEDGFRTTHISSGVMNLKKKEFHNLKQRHRSVDEYIEEFNNLACYASDEVDTDAKRKEKFLEGLNDELNLQLSVAYVPTYQTLCDKATVLGNKMKHVEGRKRKHNFDKHSSGSSHKRSHGDDSGGSRFHKHGKYNSHHNSNCHHDNKNHHIHDNDRYKNHKSGIKSHHSGNGNGSQPAKRDISQVECFKCKKTGHYANECQEKKANESNKPNSFQKGQLMLWLVSSSLIRFQHLFFLIPTHRIHSYQEHLLI